MHSRLISLKTPGKLAKSRPCPVVQLWLMMQQPLQEFSLSDLLDSLSPDENRFRVVAAQADAKSPAAHSLVSDSTFKLSAVLSLLSDSVDPLRWGLYDDLNLQHVHIVNHPPLAENLYLSETLIRILSLLNVKAKPEIPLEGTFSVQSDGTAKSFQLKGFVGNLKFNNDLTVKNASILFEHSTESSGSNNLSDLKQQINDKAFTFIGDVIFVKKSVPVKIRIWDSDSSSATSSSDFGNSFLDLGDFDPLVVDNGAEEQQQGFESLFVKSKKSILGLDSNFYSPIGTINWSLIGNYLEESDKNEIQISHLLNATRRSFIEDWKVSDVVISVSTTTLLDGTVQRSAHDKIESYPVRKGIQLYGNITKPHIFSHMIHSENVEENYGFVAFTDDSTTTIRLLPPPNSK
ncbi:hypothetical protein HK096_004776, partial [Nowakowskiella sp. JEL0078]